MLAGGLRRRMVMTVLSWFPSVSGTVFISLFSWCEVEVGKASWSRNRTYVLSRIPGARRWRGCAVRHEKAGLRPRRPNTCIYRGARGEASEAQPRTCCVIEVPDGWRTKRSDSDARPLVGTLRSGDTPCWSPSGHLLVTFRARGATATRGNVVKQCVVVRHLLVTCW